MGKALKVEELKEGQIYKCRLSGHNFMIVFGYTETRTNSGVMKSRNGDINGKYFNPVSGTYCEETLSDYQLEEIDNG